MSDFIDINEEIDVIADRTTLVAIREELRQIRSGQERSQEKIEQLLQNESVGKEMARNTTKIATEMTRMVDASYAQIAALTKTIEGLKGYLTSDATLLRAYSRGEALNDALDV